MATTTKEILDQWSKAQSDLLAAEQALNDTHRTYANGAATAHELVAAGAHLVKTRARYDRLQQIVLSLRE